MPARVTEQNWRPVLMPPFLPPERDGEGRYPGLGASTHRTVFAMEPVEQASEISAREPRPRFLGRYVSGMASQSRPTTRRGRLPPKDERPVVTDDECTLQFELVGTDGGEYSTDYSCENMLRNDGNCYSSLKRDCINVVAKVKGEPYFSITDIEAVAPIEGYTSPLGQGCIFVSWDMPNTDLVKQFDDVMTGEQFERRRQQSNLSPILPSTPVPVQFFEINKTCRVTEHLPVPRSGRYVLIKLLRSQIVPSENVDVQYIGFRGLSCPHGFESGSLL